MFLPAICNQTILRVDSAGTASYVVLIIIILLQFLQCEKTIRVRSLVKMGFNLSEIKMIFEIAPEISVMKLIKMLNRYLM